ncbi:MAG: CBS domain-containing protein [Deltaproteobacteria bacterium]|nr:CBS domain-containing protein [Deltaproteobacteria bacterium]
MLAKDIMTTHVITVSPMTSIKRLAQILSQAQISGAPVVDKTGKVIGLVSEMDLLVGKGAQVKSIMSKKVFCVTEDATLEEIASVMTRAKVKRLPVMRGEKLAGIISRADIVSALAIGEHIATHTPIYDL